MSAWLRLGSALSQETGRYIRKEYKVLSKMLEYKFPEKNVWVREINVGGESLHRSLTFKPDLPENQS